MAEHYKLQVGKRIRMRRDELGLTQKQLAERAHYKEAQSVSRWERGENLPIGNLDVIAEALEWTLPELVMGVEPPNATVARQLGLAPPASNGDTPDLVASITPATPERLLRIEEHLDALADHLKMIDGRLAKLEKNDQTAAIKRMFRLQEQILGRLGRDIGKRDLEGRDDRDRPEEPEEDVA